MDAHSTARAPVRVKGRILRYPSGTIPLSVEQTPMPAGNAAILAVLGAYFGLMLAIGAWARRSHDSAAGYFLAGRKLPYWVAAFSMNATGESAWLILGLSGVAYLTGLQALWVVAGEALGVAGAWLLVARRLNAASRDSDTITVPDFLAERFRRQAVAIRGLAVAIILAMACAYIAAQMLATGKASHAAHCAHSA